MKSVIVLSSSYPKNAEDISGVFVRKLCDLMGEDLDVHLLLPRDSDQLENTSNIHYFDYWFKGRKFTDGEILGNLKKHKWMIIQVVPFLVFQFIALIKLNRKLNASSIHAHWIFPQGLIAVLYKMWTNKKVKIVVTGHGSDVNSFSRGIKKPLIKFPIKGADSITVVSHALKNELIRIGVKKPIDVFPMGVDTALFSPDKKTKENPPKLVNLLFVGRLTEAKGIHLLIKALPKVLEKTQHVQLKIVGPGNLTKDLNDFVSNNKLSKTIEITGPKTQLELSEIFANSDIFILPSRSEGFGLVYAEAMSSGAITIGTDLLPVRDIIIEGETGFFLKRLSSEAISDKICEVIGKMGSKELEDIRASARQHILRNFDWKIVANNYVGILSK